MSKIKNEYKDKIIVLDYLYDEFKHELKRTDSYDYKLRATRKTRLQNLRKEMNTIMLDIERNYGGIYYLTETIE